MELCSKQFCHSSQFALKAKFNGLLTAFWQLLQQRDDRRRVSPNPTNQRMNKRQQITIATAKPDCPDRPKKQL